MHGRLTKTKSRYSVGQSNRPGGDLKEEEAEDTSRISNGPNVYQIGARIGKGAFGEVFQAFNGRTGDLVAVKRFALNAIEQDINSIESEVELMQRLNHPNIVKYIETIRTRSYLYIILEYMENGSLANVIDKFGSLTESLTAMYISQVLKGLKYLHEQGVLHRDIKGANILTTKDGLVKLADFGVAIKLSDASVGDQEIVGTPYWMAPEIIEMMSTPTPACDIWSVGCIIIELLTGKPPYFNLVPEAAIFRICVSDEYPPFPEGISEALRDFLYNCFRKEPIMRSSAAKLLEHPWLHNSSTTSKLERHSTMLLGNSRSLASKEGTNNNEADGMLNAIRMFQREVSPNFTPSATSEEKNPTTAEGIAMREIKVDTAATNSLSQDISQDDGSGKKKDNSRGGIPDNSNAHLMSPTFKDSSTPKLERDSSSSSTVRMIQGGGAVSGVASGRGGNDEAKEIPVENLVNRGLHRNTSDNTLIKRILSSDITGPPFPSNLAINTPDRDCNTPETNGAQFYNDKVSAANKKLMTPKSSFKSMKAISEDSVDSWDAEIVADLKSSSNDSTVNESQSIIRRIDLAAVKKGFINSASFQRNDAIGRRIPSSANVLRAKSSVSMNNNNTNHQGNYENNNSNFRLLQKNSGILSPHQSNYLLQKYQEKADEENYDDLLEASNYIEHDPRKDSHSDDPFDDIDNLSSADTQDRSHTERSIQTHVPLQPHQLQRQTSRSNVKKLALESLQTMSSEDYDDLFEDNDTTNHVNSGDAVETDQNGELVINAAPNFAKKLKQKLTNWSKELAEDEMDSFLNNQFEEKDFQQDEQKDIHFRRSKDIVELLNKIRPTVTNEEILDFTNQILNLFDRYPEQRDHVITNHGVMPIMDMFEAKAFRSSHSLRFEIYGYNVLKIVNKIVEGSVRAQEQLSFVGIIPSIINFFERSCRPASPRKSFSGLSPNRAVLMGSPLMNKGGINDDEDNTSSFNSPSSIQNNVGSSTQGSGKVGGNNKGNSYESGDLDPLAMEAARFIHTISISSSLTLQMLISAGGLSVLTTMASFGCRITSGSSVTSSSHRRLHSWEELIKREEIRRSEEVEEVTDVNNPDLLNVQVTDRIYDSDSKRFIEIFQMGMDCISRVFAAQKSRTRDFCRLFVKFGLLTHLSSAFENLMTIYKSFLQKSQLQQQQMQQQHQHHLSNSHVQPDGNSAFKYPKNHADGTMSSGSNEENHQSLAHKRSGSGTLGGNISRSDSSASMEAGNLDNCSEALYAQAIAAVFFKFSRSDAIVAETMANAEKGVISVVLSTLQAPELKNTDTSSTLNSLLTSSPGSSMILPNPSTVSSGSATIGHRRTRSGPQPAYVEIVELLLKCLKNLSMEPSAIEYLEKAGTIETLVPLLNGPISDKCKVHILPCIFNMCRIHRKRSDLAAASGIVPHLKKVITEGSHLRQFALPIMFDLANGSAATREVLWKNECVEFYLDLLKENYWATFALNSLAIWLSNEVSEKEVKVSNLAKMLIQPPCLLKLIEFFRSASKQTAESLHKPLLDMMSKSKELSCALAMSGVFVSALVKRLLITNEAIVLRSLLKMLQLLHQNHPCPRQLVLDNNLYKLVKEFAQSETKVVVQQIANRLLADFQVSTLT